MPGVKTQKNIKNIHMAKKFNCKSAIILGMHDAIVSLIGLIVGLYFTFTDPNIIIISCIIASISAALSMAAANYLAVKSTNTDIATISGLCTGGAYLVTCCLMVLPFLVFQHNFIALVAVFVIATLIIFLFNAVFYRGKRFWRCFIEMLATCTTVTIVAFLIAEFANKWFGI